MRYMVLWWWSLLCFRDIKIDYESSLSDDQSHSLIIRMSDFRCHPIDSNLFAHYCLLRWLCCCVVVLLCVVIPATDWAQQRCGVAVYGVPASAAPWSPEPGLVSTTGAGAGEVTGDWHSLQIIALCPASYTSLCGIKLNQPGDVYWLYIMTMHAGQSIFSI